MQPAAELQFELGFAGAHTIRLPAQEPREKPNLRVYRATPSSVAIQIRNGLMVHHAALSREQALTVARALTTYAEEIEP